MGSKSLTARRGWRVYYSGGNRKAAVAVLLLILAGPGHGQGHGEIMVWMKLFALSTSWPPPPADFPDPLPLMHESATCPADRKAYEDGGKKEAIDKNTGRGCTGSLVSKSTFVSPGLNILTQPPTHPSER